MHEAGFTDFDVGELGGTVEGFVIDRIMSPRAALEPLMLAHFFDAAETQGRIRFRHFDDAPVAALTPDGLAVGEASAAPGYALTRGQETELPLSAKLAYIEGGGEYRQAAVEARRLTGNSERVVTATLPMVLTQAAAQMTADIWMQKAWSERERAALSLPPSRLALDPGDVVTLELPHRSLRVRLSEIADTATREARGVESEASLFGPVTAPVRANLPAAAPSYGTPLAVFMDMPLLTGEEVPHAPRVAVAADPWPGGVAFFKSAASGFLFDRIVTLPATLGHTLTPLMPGPVGRWDPVNEFTVELSSGELASADALSVLAGANAAALETPEGDWEVLQFREAQLIAPGEVRLAGLLRGQAGTEAAMRAPLMPGARFVLLDAAVSELGMSDAERGLARIWAYGPAPLPRDDESYASVTRAFDGVGLRPLSPVHLRAARSAEGDIEFRWIRRTRIGGDSWAGLDVPLGEESERYEIEIRDGAAVKRILTAVTPQASYSAAEQIADFGAADFPALEISVYQLSASFGRGGGAHATLGL